MFSQTGSAFLFSSFSLIPPGYKGNCIINGLIMFRLLDLSDLPECRNKKNHLRLLDSNLLPLSFV